MIKKIYLFSSIFYDRNNISYSGISRKKAFMDLDEAYKCALDIHNGICNEYRRISRKYSEEIRSFRGKIKYNFIIKDEHYIHVVSIEEVPIQDKG